ncbi:hypothetical protein [Labrys neptuniae]|uniref:Uncharacterized protein n=1 Tax=Labrys neptuniae TaxID=376174 RepID=A0ABV3PKZ9_9HYPH
MRFEVEKKAPVENVKEAKIRAVLNSLRNYGPSSFASITDDIGNYLQVAGGGLHCMLERYDAKDNKFYRAYLDSKSKIFSDGTILAFGGGELKLLSDEWVSISIVIEAFVAFLNHKDLPSKIKWRDITSNFQ